MKGFIFFFLTVLLIYFGVNTYIYRSFLAYSTSLVSWRWLIRTVLIIGISAYPLGRLLYHFDNNLLSKFFYYLGSFWLGLMFYALLGFLLFDLIKLFNHFFPFLPDGFFSSDFWTRRVFFSFSGVLLILLITGHINSLYPRIVKMEFTSEGYPADKKEMKIVAVSDVHIGMIINENRVKRMVNQINLLNPDLVLIVGDLLDESPRHFQPVSEVLKKLNSRFGVYAVTGNHEFYNNLEAGEDFIGRSNIRLLRDETVLIDSSLNLVGLDDRPGAASFKLNLESVSEIIKDIDNSKPTLLLHHTPMMLEEISDSGVDFMICGHTHNGQLWPAGYLAGMTYKKSKGLHLIKGMKLFISNGYGTWGPPLRIGASPQIVEITLRKGKA